MVFISKSLATRDNMMGHVLGSHIPGANLELIHLLFGEANVERIIRNVVYFRNIILNFLDFHID